MIKGGVSMNARSRQPPHTQENKLVWVRRVVCSGTQTDALIVVV
jgi:hypothetical protein